jgi:PAS domain S-box-containing protein
MTNESRSLHGAERRLQFLLDLGDRLRGAESPKQVARVAARMLAGTLKVGRSGYGHIGRDGLVLTIEADCSDAAMASLAGETSILAMYGAEIVGELLSGRTVAVADCRIDARTVAPDVQAVMDDTKIRAFVIAPLMNSARMVGLVYVHSAAPRRWAATEIALVEDVGARSWSAYRQSRAEAALRHSEERLKDITDALPVLISYLDSDERFQFANKPYEWWFDRPRDQIIGRTLKELMSPSAYDARKPFVDRALAGETMRYEVDMQLAGGLVNTEVLNIPHRDDIGRTVGIYALVQDITERKKSEKALRESELKFRQFAEQNPAMIWSCDETGQLTYLSSRWYEFTGHNPTTPLAQNWDQVVHPDDQAELHAKWVEALDTKDVYTLEVRFLRYDGVYRWHSIRAEPLRNSDGAISGWLGTNSDVDDAVREREERKRDHDRLWRISQELMVVRDLAGIIISANPSVTRLLGWRPDEIVGKSVYELVHPDDLEHTILKVGSQLASHGMLAIQNRYLCKDGSYRTIDWRGVLYEGHVHSVGRDITAEKQAAEELQKAEEALRQSQKMETVGRLTGGIAHDFNNMLAGIIGSLNLLQRRIAAGRIEETTRFIEAAQTSAQRAAALTQRLLAFGRRQALDIRPVNVAELLESLDDLLRRTIGPSIDLRIDAADEPWFAEVDANQLESAILNLAINARDAMPQGGTLTLGVRNAAATLLPLRPAGDHVELYVADTGEGMPPDVVRQAFEPFFTTKPPGQGTGLGLSMVYGFLNQIGGDARIESVVGEGTTVRLFLPRSHRQVVAPPDEAAVSAPVGAGETVLLVEDDHSVRMLVMEVLNELGYAGLPVADAPSALPIIRSGRDIDLMISDIGLPGMNGRDLAEIARKERPGLKILFITGYAEAATNRSSFLAPGMHMLTKPFSIDQLALKINEVLKSTVGMTVP